MTAKALLRVILKADETVVAEIDDPILWQKVLAIANGGSKSADLGKGLADAETSAEDHLEDDGDQDESVARFAKSLGIAAADLNGALEPIREAPYLHLNSHNWEAFKRNFPVRGAGAVSPIGLVGTALALWLKAAKIDVAATQALALGVLSTINVHDKNASRGISNTKWLQARSGGMIIVNPAEISKAQEIVRAFCLKRAPSIES